MGSATINPDITDVSDVAYIPVPSLNFLSSWFGRRPGLRATLQFFTKGLFAIKGQEHLC
jgi:hypothetical protein